MFGYLNSRIVLVSTLGPEDWLKPSALVASKGGTPPTPTPKAIATAIWELASHKNMFRPSPEVPDQASDEVAAPATAHKPFPYAEAPDPAATDREVPAVTPSISAGLSTSWFVAASCAKETAETHRALNPAKRRIVFIRNPSLTAATELVAPADSGRHPRPLHRLESIQGA